LIKTQKTQRLKESIFKSIFAMTAVFTIIAVIAIIIFLLFNSIPAFQKIGFFNFIFGKEWNSSSTDTYDAPVSGMYGILTMIVGSLFATSGAILVGGTLGFFTAVYIVEFCPKRLKQILSNSINLLAGIPSVVYGFFGMRVLLPLLGNFSANGDGSGILSVSIILGIMIMPTVTALSKASIEAVDRTFYEGSIALGASRERSIFKVIVPASKNGILASIILGVGRAIGETMAVVMIAGNNPVFLTGLFSSFRTATANIVMEMSYGGELQTGALIATGVILTFFILVINICFNIVRRPNNRNRSRTKLSDIIFKFNINNDKTNKNVNAEINKHQFLIRSKHFDVVAVSLKYLSLLSAIIGILALLTTIIFIFVNGLPYITSDLLFGEFTYGGNPSIASSIISTLMLVVITSIFAFPIGIMAAIFLAEYSRKDSKLVKLIRLMSETLSGIPSIVYGLFGMLFFTQLMKLGTSILAGGLTLTLMIIPTTIRGTEEALLMVNESLREASYALGAGKLRTIRKVVLPGALPGILASVILGISRIISESAPVLFTMGASIKPMPKNFSSSGASLAVALYALGREWMHINESYATACILIILVLILNTLSQLIAKVLGKRLKGT
jgi:phosphate transport system permease protein